MSVIPWMTVGTNLLLAVQCLLYGLMRRSSADASFRRWSWFFLAMAVTNLAGAAKHGFVELLPPYWATFVMALTNVTGGWATWLGQHAEIGRRSGDAEPGVASRLVDAQLALFLVANFILGPHFTVLLVNLVVGFAPVAFSELQMWRSGRPGAGAATVAFAGMAVVGVAFAAGVRIDPWVTRVDVAHALMLVPLHWLAIGTVFGGGDAHAARAPMGHGSVSEGQPGFA